MEKLFVLDASGYIYRSYFAIRNMTNAKGESTNALYGFIRSVLKLRKDFNPEHLVAVFDGPASIKHREAIYADYKAHRTETPQDLRYQINWAKQACDLLGIPFLDVPNVEADDTMGSVALWAIKHDAEVYLCTSDKDLCQLVNDKISILNTFKENLILGPKEVKENFGVTPEQMVDYLAIVGDASDNVPGLPGFGPKTASALLQEFGSLDYILEHPDVVSGKKKETVVQFADQARMSRQLVTIHTDVEFPQDKTFFTLRPCDFENLKAFYSSMNFSSLIRELEQPVSAENEPSLPPAAAESISYSLVEDSESFSQLMDHLSTCHSIAISTVGTESQPMKSQFVGIAFSTEPSTAWYVPVNGQLGLSTILTKLKNLLENPKIHFFGHNIKYDMLVLSSIGIQLSSISFDAMLASYLLNSHSRQHTLEQLMLEYFGKVRPDISTLLGKGRNAIRVIDAPPKHMYAYYCEGVDYISRLRLLLEPQLKNRHLQTLFSDLELPLLTVLATMEKHGIYVNIPYLQKMSGEIQHLIANVAAEIYLLAGEQFNINSPKQLSEILFTKMGIRAPKKTATGLSTNADVLESLKHEHPIAGKVIEYRTLEKLRSTYLDTLPLEVNPKTDRIHCTFNQTVAATGRLSSQDPNLQNIPIRTEIGRKIRGAFRPQKEGWSFLAADYSQIELRILAHLSDDPHMIEAFINGEDIHTSTAAYIFNVPLDQVTREQRYGAKAVNFGIVYGQQAYGLSQELGIEIKDAAIFIEAYFKRYGRVRAFIEENKEKARTTGKAVTYTGRERLIPEIHSKNGQIRAAAERLAINTPLQGTAADLIKMAMLNVDKKLKENKCSGYLILQIHDELVFEIPDEEIPLTRKIVQETMQDVLKLKVPLIVDVMVGKNWAEC